MATIKERYQIEENIPLKQFAFSFSLPDFPPEKSGQFGRIGYHWEEMGASATLSENYRSNNVPLATRLVGLFYNYRGLSQEAKIRKLEKRAKS